MSSPSAEDLRDKTRQQILDSMGGWSGTVVAAIPPVAFVVVNAVAHHLRTAIIAAVASGVLVAGYRLVRRQPVQQAATGLFTVLIAALIAARTGQARGFFLLGIAGSLLYGAIFLVSLLVRRPLVGVAWEFLDPSPLPEGTRWHKVRVLRRGYDLATCAALAMFAARAIVQLSLFRDNKTGWLAVTKIAMGFPLYLAVVGIVFWMVRRARQQLEPLAEVPAPGEAVEAALTGSPEPLAEPGPATPEPGAPVPLTKSGPAALGGADGLADSRLGLGQGDE